MASVEITTKSIDKIKNNPKELEQFEVVTDTQSERDYAKFISKAIFTRIKTEAKDGIKSNLQKIKELSVTTRADIFYLFELLAKAKSENANLTVKTLPVIELYEQLLKENWQTIEYDRRVLNEAGMLDYTSEGNMKICEAIITFLKENVLNKTAASSTTNNAEI